MGDLGIETLRKPRHQLLEPRLLEHEAQRVFARVGCRVEQVVAQRASQHGGLLLDVADLCA